VKIPTIRFTKLLINREFIDSISSFQFSLFLVKLLHMLRFFSLRYDPPLFWLYYINATQKNPRRPVKPTPLPCNALTPHGFLLNIVVHGFKTSNS
jgi:hypothetical protein